MNPFELAQQKRKQEEQEKREENYKKVVEDLAEVERKISELNISMKEVFQRRDTALKKIDRLELKIRKCDDATDKFAYDTKRIKSTITELLTQMKRNPTR